MAKRARLNPVSLRVGCIVKALVQKPVSKSISNFGKTLESGAVLKQQNGHELGLPEMELLESKNSTAK